MRWSREYGGSEGPCPDDQDKVPEGWTRCLLAGGLSRLRECGQPGYIPDKGGMSPSRRAAGLPHPKVAQREGHIPVFSYARNVAPQVRAGGGACPGAGGWGGGLASRARKTLQVPGRNRGRRAPAGLGAGVCRQQQLPLQTPAGMRRGCTPRGRPQRTWSPFGCSGPCRG